jgi:hypothetical protein
MSMMTTIFKLTCTRQGQEPQVWYFSTLQGAQEHQRLAHEDYILNHLSNANRIKGALRGRGQASLMALASGIVADNIQFNITREWLRGEDE